jgi:hypothetical protein
MSATAHRFIVSSALFALGLLIAAAMDGRVGP